jgi:hypothetical protein
MSELKPCPFKFLDDVRVFDEVEGTRIEAVSSDNLEYGITMHSVLPKEETIEAWNVLSAPKVKALEWSVEVRGSRTSGIMGENYEINMTSKGYDLWLDRDDQCVDIIGNYETLEEAKSGAQSYYENQILQALE